MRSMTGFGRAEVSTPYGKFVLELQSVNRRFLEISVYLPREISSFETKVKGILGEKLFRGQISARFSLFPDEKSSMGLFPKAEFLKRLRDGWIDVAEKSGISKEEVNLSFLVNQLEHLHLEEPYDLDLLEQPLGELASHALCDLIQMREQEGEKLLEDMERRLDLINTSVGAIETLAPIANERLKGKLEERIIAFKEMEDSDERILREIAIFAEKIDIAEEITRLRSHIEQFRNKIRSDAGTLGKTMDFILQEMMRESNTIASKCSEIDISKHVVTIKSELERIKEQTQNIE